MGKLDPPICVALDVPDLALARRLLDALEGMVPVFKVGLELFCAEGPAAVEEVLKRGAEVFLDLKINDIPNTAAGAVASAGRIGASYLTVHSNGGREMVRAAVEAAGDDNVRILVVSVITSLDDAALAEVGVARGTDAQVDAMARLAVEERAAGLVLAAGDAARVRESHGELFLVTPGIRPASTAAGDQRRIGTPSAAISAGADLLVVARVVADAPDPARALTLILDEVDAARAGVGR